MEFKISKEKVGDFLYKRVVKEKLSTFYGKKANWRYEIHKNIFDIYDSVADNSKMIALIFALLHRIYDALPEDVKKNIPQKEREIIEYAFEIFKAIKTRADVQFEKEGEKFIKKLFKRQAEIANIIEGKPINDINIDDIKVKDLSDKYKQEK